MKFLEQKVIQKNLSGRLHRMKKYLLKLSISEISEFLTEAVNILFPKRYFPDGLRLVNVVPTNNSGDM